MSNKDGKSANKPNKHAAGKPCPQCSAKRSKRPTEKSGKVPKLEVVHDCKGKKGHEHHVYCAGCKWTNF